jgi:predicted cobalt transporter CbtA
MLSVKHGLVGLLGVAIASLPVSIVRGQTPAQPASPSIEVLVRDGWTVAGYVAASDIRTLILLRHASHAWLVQCSVLIDVTRTPRQIVTCYELR